MIKAFTAFTAEIDDTEAAVGEIMDQLDQCGGLLKNSVGLLACYSEFIDSDVIKELCEALPFEVIGTTTLCNAVQGATGRMLLTMIVLSSDDAEFSVGLTDTLTTADETPLREAYEKAASKLASKPALMVSFAPLLVNASGDFYADAFTKISGGVPNFGMLAVDHNTDYHDSQVICAGEAYRDRYAFLLVSGVTPRFFIASISSEKIFMDKGVVTAASRNQVQTINNRPVIEYLQSLGLKKNDEGTITGVNSFPFVVDYNDDTTPVVRVIFAITEEGYAVCGGDIPNGATLSVGHIDTDEVLSTTTNVISEAIASGKPDCILMFSCAGRYFALGFQPLSEMEHIQKILGETAIPYHIAYSGGELCPVYSRNKEVLDITNRNHNDTFIMCLL
jgi:hypothetical protein